MAADDYFDAIGNVLSYVLSAEDTIVGQRNHKSGTYIIINRSSTDLEFFAHPNDRYFTIIYQFSLTRTLIDAYKRDNQILRGHLERDDIDDAKIGDDNLNEKVAYERIKDVETEAAEKLVSEIQSVSIHSDCRIEGITDSGPDNGNDTEEIWDGVMVAGLLYPYEENFGPREYEQVAQEVISVGNQIDSAMEKLDVMEEIGFESN